MINRLSKRISALVSFVLLTSAAFPQVKLSENQFLHSSISASKKYLSESQKSIYSGPLYNQYFTKLSSFGHPFYDELKSKSIRYSGVHYINVTFLYDTFEDEVVVLRTDNEWVMIDKGKIDFFYLGNHQFKRFNDNTLSGFYEILSEHSNVMLLAKWSKLFRASHWKKEVQYYLVKEGVVPIKTKRNLINALGDRMPEVKNFISQNKLKFGKDHPESFAKVVDFYSSIKP